MIRRTLPVLTALALVGSASVLTGAPAIAAAPSAAQAETTPTRFALAASGYASRVVGGRVPASSDRSAFQVIGCTNRAGLNKTNAEVHANVAPLLATNDAATRVWTTQENGVVSSWARNRIASVRIGNSTTATTASIRGIASTSRAFHNATGFHATTRTSVADILLDADGTGPLPAVSLGVVPTAGKPVRLPGLAVISVGPSKRSNSTTGARAEADALRVKIIPTGTVTYLAHSRATIGGGVISGLFRGSSYASRATALGGRVTSGKTPYLVMPCQGTDGEVVRRDIARADPKVLIRGVVARGLHAEQSADQTARRAFGYERGSVANLTIGDLVVRGIVGKANVRFVRGEGITKNVNGSQILGVTFNGNPRTIGGDNVLRIAGVAKLEQRIVKRTKLTIQVTELRVTLLGGPSRGAVIDLGVAKVGFSKSGL